MMIIRRATWNRLWEGYQHSRKWALAWKVAAKRWHGEYLECFDDFVLLDTLLDEARQWARKLYAENQRLRELIKKANFDCCPWCSSYTTHYHACPAYGDDGILKE